MAVGRNYTVSKVASSKIYHKPGQRFYNRTNPEVCFATDADAVRAGYRKAKV